ncbi:MAG TPA: twin-arginine translocase subunit TatC [Ktedonobacteraceae bacterium]|jgi:sec-independent protein translocase protein TatC
MATNIEDDPLGALTNLFTSDEEPDPNDPSAMSLVDHLEELRRRIFKMLIAIAIFSVVAFIFREQLMNFLTWPLPHTADLLGHGNQKLVVTGLGEGFTTFLLLSIAGGFVAALPVILYQVWAFVAPGLYAHEKKHAVPFIVAGLILFVAGLALGYVVLQYPVAWLVNFASDSFTELVSVSSYFTFVAFFLLAFGVVFEIPLVLTFLSIIGMITAETLTKKRAVAHVGMWIAATIITPGADLYSPIILGVAMSCLFELSVIFIKFTQHMRERSAAKEADV